MPIDRQWRLFTWILLAAAVAALAQPSVAQEPTAPAPTTPLAPLKPEHPEAAKPHHHAARPPESAAAQPTLLKQYGDWGAYTASPGGKKVCFVISKPIASETNPANRPRDPCYMFVSTRPADKVKNEVSIIIGYKFKPNSDATAEVGSTTFALYTDKDGAWIKNAAEEAHMVEAMRAGEKAVVKGVSTHGTRTTDTFSLKGLAEALDRSDQECK